MFWPTLDDIKAQCRLDKSDNAEDDLLIGYMLAARDHIQQHLNRRLFDKKEDIPVDQVTGLALVNTDLSLDTSAGYSISLACKLLVAHWFENREATSTLTIKMVPLAFESLLAPYRMSPS